MINNVLIIGGGISGIMLLKHLLEEGENNVIVLKDDIDIYWSNKGQRSCEGVNADHRLSLRYKLNKPEINYYIYKKGTTELTPQIINVVVKPNVECPVTV